ncbi:MAG: HPr family phosphocarrier protein [Calditrichaceae bacterium]
MIEEILRIKNKNGLHARPAAHLVKVAGKFISEIKILKDGLEVNGKSIMGVMMLAAETGSELVLQIDGNDELEAMKAIKELIDKNFYEE